MGYSFTLKDFKRWYKSNVSKKLKVTFYGMYVMIVKEKIESYCKQKDLEVDVKLTIVSTGKVLEITRKDEKGKAKVAIWIEGNDSVGGYLLSDV